MVKSLKELSEDLEVDYEVRAPHPQPLPADTILLLHQISRDVPRALEFHAALEGNQETPLVDLGVVEGIGRVFVKDEGQRLGMKAFKVLGGTYAVHRLQQRGELPPGCTLTTMTDGNHGAGVAYAARQAGHPAVIYVPSSMVPARRQRIEEQGARVVVVEGEYDRVVEQVRGDAGGAGWVLVGDTSWEGYEVVPRDITTAYSTIFSEAVAQIRGRGHGDVTHLLLQTGVGSFAAGGIAYCQSTLTTPPVFICVEPKDADCVLENVRRCGDGTLQCKGKTESISAGLNCGTPASKTAWPLLRDCCSGYLALGDGWAIRAVRELYERGVESGESGCVGYAGVLAIKDNPTLRDQLGFGEEKVVLVINTEGATDPVLYGKITEGATSLTQYLDNTQSLSTD